MKPQDLWEALERADGFALNAALADDTQFTQVHSITGLEMPTSVQAAYLRHNGQAASGLPLFNGQYRWLSLGEVVREWRDWQALMQDESMAELTPKAGSASKVSASMANARVKAAAISPGLFAVGGDAFKGGRVTLDAARSGAYAIGAAAADVVGGVIGLSDPRRAQMPGTKDTACSGNDFLTRDNVSLDDESVLQSRHTACAIAPTVNTSVTSYNTAGIPRYGDMSVAWKWNVHGPSGALSKNIRLSFDYTYVPRGTTTTAGAPVLKVLAKATCDVTNINAFNPDVVNCGGTADYTLNTGARDQGKDFKLTVDWDDSNGRKIAEFRPVLRLYYTTDGSTPQVDAAGNPQASTYELDNSNMQLVMRCDKGQVWGSSNGCVFPKAAAVLDVTGTPQSAQHMREASAANPYLPGRYPGLKPGTKAVANEAASPVLGL